MFRVVRTEHHTGGDWSVGFDVVWTGDSPADYRAGLGCFDNGESVVNRWMEANLGNGWRSVTERMAASIVDQMAWDAAIVSGGKEFPQ